MKSEDVARYLHDHPEFFDQYADMLALVTLPDPHSGRAISITEKQLFNLRDKVRTLESKLVELIGFGEENDAIGGKVHGALPWQRHDDLELIHQRRENDRVNGWDFQHAQRGLF